MGETMKQSALAMLRGVMVFVMVRLIAQYVFDNLLRYPAYSLATIVAKDCISIAAGSFVAGYSVTEKGWLIGLGLSSSLCIGLVALWTYLSESPFTHTLYGIVRHPTTVLQFPAFLVIGALSGAAGNLLRNKTARAQVHLPS